MKLTELIAHLMTHVKDHPDDDVTIWDPEACGTAPIWNVYPGPLSMVICYDTREKE